MIRGYFVYTITLSYFMLEADLNEITHAYTEMLRQRPNVTSSFNYFGTSQEVHDILKTFVLRPRKGKPIYNKIPTPESNVVNKLLLPQRQYNIQPNPAILKT